MKDSEDGERRKAASDSRYAPHRTVDESAMEATQFLKMEEIREVITESFLLDVKFVRKSFLVVVTFSGVLTIVERADTSGIVFLNKYPVGAALYCSSLFVELLGI